MELFIHFVEGFEADINAENLAGETPFIIAAREGRIDIIRHYLNNYPDKFDIEHKMKDGWTALMYATINGNCSIVSWLIKSAEADVNTTDRLGRTCLHWSARYNNNRLT